MENINIEEIIYKWFEMKYRTYDKLEHDGSIYLYYDDEEYADIMLDKKYKFIDYQWKFYEEFSDIISIQRNVFDMVMTKWVEDTFGLKGFTSRLVVTSSDSIVLKIPKIKK